MAQDAPIGRSVFVEGRVQGVWFRGSCVEAADRIGGLTGWVRNLPDGRVEAHVHGAATAVEALLAWMHEGPPHADVRRVEAAPCVGGCGALPAFEFRR